MVSVTLPRSAWRGVYAACVGCAEYMMAEDGPPVSPELAELFQVLPALAEAAQCPDLRRVEAELRLLAQVPTEDVQVRMAKTAVSMLPE